MSGGRDWSKVREIVAKARGLGLSLKEGAKRFGVKVGVLYEYNRRQAGTRRKGEGNRGPVRESDNVGTADGSAVAAARTGLPEEVKERICAYRRAHPEQGFKCAGSAGNGNSPQ
ncbi:MAG: hypothetical protein AB1714_31860 [Acidobacteriota bacterium]